MGCRLSGPWLGDGMGVNGRDLSHIRKREALRILASYEQPITLQIEGSRGRSLHLQRTTDCSTQTERPWDPLRTLGCSVGSAPRVPYPDRHHYNHMTMPDHHRNGARYEYLPNAPRDIEELDGLGYHEPELPGGVPQGQNCLIGCCNSNMEEPTSFHSQMEEEDFMMEKPVGYLPLHHELDSGLGWTDGSFHQGELSGMETEEGLEECHVRGGGGGGGGGSPSSESFISSELSDSGFYSVSTSEFLRFQRLLEKRMRLYNARMHHQGDLCPRERRDSQKAHRELEAIPEALTVQPQNSCGPGVPSPASVGPRGLFRVSSVQFRKADRPCLNRHSSSSGSLYTPHAILSTCSTPSGQRRPLPHQSSSAGLLRRSRTLHHRAPPTGHRRRASHPASPNYCSATLHHCGQRLATELPEELEPVHIQPCHALHQPGRLPPSPEEHRCALPIEHYCDSNGNPLYSERRPDRSFMAEPGEGREREVPRYHTLSHPPAPAQDIHETWPKPANRMGMGGGGGLYSTLEGHIPTSGSRKPSSGNQRAYRNQLLRDRASRLADERSGMSTDEESHSEVRRGRYWSRTERREHLLLAREQRQQQHQARGGGAGLASGGGVVGGANADSSYNTVLELSQRKLSRLRNRKLLDDWTTVEELLTHGTRLGSREDILCPSSLLTVTTV